MAQIGKTVLILLGLLGGLSAILMGLGVVLYWVISASSSHIPREWIEGSLISPEIGGLLYIVLGSMGALGALLIYTRYLKASAALLLASGVLGFLVSYASSSHIMGLMNWIAPGILLILAGILTLITPERFGSRLPLLKSDRQNVRRVGYAVFGILLLFFLWTTLMVGILSFLGTLTFSVPDHKMGAEDALTDAAVAESMGVYSEALKAYDRAIALNSSNVEAWYRKGYALHKLGMSNNNSSNLEDAIQCYDKVIELNQSFNDAYPMKNARILKSEIRQFLWQKYRALEGMGAYERANESFIEFNKMNRI
jgi:tetratricopeptide (TPR) repeat protein